MSFTFIDLFAGIGGIRKGFESQGGRCKFTCEWDKYAQQTYSANFNDEIPLFGNIKDLSNIGLEIPDHDILLAGFPCQPFSIAGVSKKSSLGRKHGFECKTQGTLFYDVAKIIKEKKPKAFLLENVKNLKSHDKGRTFDTIYQVLTEELGYQVYTKIIDAKYFVPQHRERIFLVGFKDKVEFNWNDLKLPSTSPSFESILHTEDGKERLEKDYILEKIGKVNPKYTLSDKLWNYLQEYARKHKEKGNGFGFGLADLKGVSRTLSARYYKDGSEVLIPQGKSVNPRRLTPRECARLMGYADDFQIPVSDTQAYKQFGNSVVVPVIAEIARIMVPHVVGASKKRNKKSGTFKNLKDEKVVCGV